MCKRFLNAASHARGAPDANVKVIVMRKRATRLGHEFRRARANRGGNAIFLRIREKPLTKLRSDENVCDLRVRVRRDRRDERPVLRVIKVGAWPSVGGAIGFERDEVLRHDGLSLFVFHVETKVCVTTALMRSMPIELASTGARQMPHGENRVGVLLSDGARGVLYKAYKRLEPPSNVAARVNRHDAQRRPFRQMRATDEMPVRW